MAHSRIKGFTLIELLVVIAIIAILAAILFPVFAQARAAARGASSQSNLKQLSLGVIMYVQDYDETYPCAQRWGVVGASGYAVSFSTAYYTQWSYDIAPYIKNVQVFADPLQGTIKQSSSLWPLYTNYGYNYTALAPSDGVTVDVNGFWLNKPAALASVSRPASLVLLGGRHTYEELGGYESYGVGKLTNFGTLEAPDCSDIVPWCFTDWAPDGNYHYLTTAESGLYTGGTSLRKALNANLAFTDGHVKFLQAGQAAIGTNWYKGILSGNVHILTPNQYQWATQP